MFLRFPLICCVQNASGSFFSEALFQKYSADSCGGSQGQSSPGVEKAEHLSYDIQGVAGSSPPMVGVEGAVQNSVDHGFPVGSGKMFPEDARAARVDFGGHKDHATRTCAGESLTNGGHLIGRINDGRFQHMDRGFGDAFVDENEFVVNVFPLIGDGEFGKCRPRLRGVGQPNLRRTTLLVHFCGFQGPVRHAAAQDHDGRGVLQGIFSDKPATDMKENKEASADQTEGQKRP